MRDRWARLRFAVIGPLLASPPAAGELRDAIAKLAAKRWQHPLRGEPTRFAFATIERWYYTARNAHLDPVAGLRRRVRRDAGRQVAITAPQQAILRAQHRDHPSWSYQLHFDNLGALVAGDAALGVRPSYATVRRWMKSQDLRKRRHRRHGLPIVTPREVRSYEAEYVHGLWHADFHLGSLFTGSQTMPATLRVFDEHGGSDTVLVPILAVPHVPRAIYAEFGDGCPGSLGVPAITPSGSPRLGASLTLQLDGLPQHAAVLLTGFSNSSSPLLGVLPIDLGPIGAAGCWLRVSPDVAIPLGGAANRATYSLNVPNLASLDGLAIYHQALAPDPAAGNGLSAVLSAAEGGLVGS